LTHKQRAPAKLNLELLVLGRRPDGSHEVATVLQAIDLCDHLSIEPGPVTSLAVEGGFAVPSADNLVLRAAAEIGLSGRFVLEKSIPPGAGLGGGSSDAAAVLREGGRGRSDLVEIAARLGADVPFFLRGGRARATGRGEVLQPLEVEPGWYALAWPGFELSTAAVYAAWDSVGGDGRNQLFRAACTVEKGLAEYAAGLGDGWVMTGSGSAFFHEAASEIEARRLVARQDGWTAVAASLPAWGSGVSG
jgi:4-diphosphocytidyl-2C-methyl-D-erythritol kinase